MTKRRSGLVDLLRVLVDVYVDQCVATQVSRERAALTEGLAVEDHLLIVADREGRVDTSDLANRQVQTIEIIRSVRLFLRTLVVTRLAGTNTMPYERNLIRTNRQRRVNGIDMVDS